MKKVFGLILLTFSCLSLADNISMPHSTEANSDYVMQAEQESAINDIFAGMPSPLEDFDETSKLTTQIHSELTDQLMVLLDGRNIEVGRFRIELTENNREFIVSSVQVESCPMDTKLCSKIKDRLLSYQFPYTNEISPTAIKLVKKINMSIDTSNY